MVQLPIPHPGETIKEDYLTPLGMSVNALAKALGIGAPRLNDIFLMWGPMRAGAGIHRELKDYDHSCELRVRGTRA